MRTYPGITLMQGRYNGCCWRIPVALHGLPEAGNCNIACRFPPGRIQSFGDPEDMIFPDFLGTEGIIVGCADTPIRQSKEMQRSHSPKRVIRNINFYDAAIPLPESDRYGNRKSRGEIYRILYLPPAR